VEEKNMGLIVINDGWDGSITRGLITGDLDDIRILCCNNSDVLEADIVLQVRDWLFHIYDGGCTEENRHWTNRRALANAVVAHAIKMNKQFWMYVPSKVYLTVGDIFEELPKFTYSMVEDEVLSSMSPP
jgi:hypothetical protein